MSIQIDCPDCGGTQTKVLKTFPYVEGACTTCDHTGKITVYSQSEVDSLVEAKKEACAVVCDKYMKDVDKSISKLPPHNRNIHMEGLAMGAEECADAIRSK